MSYKLLAQAIKETINFVNNKELNCALIGGLAVSFRTIERTTKDIDLVLSASSEVKTEEIIRLFIELGFSVDTLLEKKNNKGIATVRLLNQKFPNVYLDLLFNSIGIEKEIVESAEYVEILPKLKVKIATLPALIAMKVLSANEDHRIQDVVDLKHLISQASKKDLEQAQTYINLITKRGYNSNQDLNKKYEDYKKRFFS